jgi:lysyl-tRNA synthetase class 2
MQPSLNNLILRSKLLSLIRKFFDARGFIEVESPVRILAPAPEPHIDCPPCGKGFLRASPELQMKKLLAMGMEKIYQIGPCFRDGEKGSRHNPEFTMLEWYRANGDYNDIANDMELLVRQAFLVIKGVDLPFPFKRLSVRDAYIKFAGWDPIAEWDGDKFDYDMAVKVEPSLPKEPIFLYDYPAQAASLSKIKKDDSRLAERWELYVGGMELANAFTELTDPNEQRTRFLAAKEERKILGESDYPLDEEFLTMLQMMPPSGGVALGIDRLLMLLCDAKSIGEVRLIDE